MNWILDVIFFVVLITGMLIGVKRGFIVGVCKVAGTVLSIAMGVLFCNGMALLLENWFGMTTALTNAINNATIAGFISVGIGFLIVFTLSKLGTWLLGRLGTALANSVKIFDVLNRLFGGLLGLFEALVFSFLILTLCYWLDQWFTIPQLVEFIENSSVIGAIFKWDWFIELAHFYFLFPKEEGAMLAQLALIA